MAFTRRLFALLGLAALGWPVPAARGGATVDLLFVEQNGVAIPASNKVVASDGDVLVMSVFLSTDEPLAASIFSMHYDLTPDLILIRATAWQGLDLGGGSSYVPAPVPVLTPSATARVLGSFGGAVSDSGAPQRLLAGAYEIGTVVWQMGDGTWYCRNQGCVGESGYPDTIRSGLFRVGDGFLNAAFEPVDTLVRFGTGFAGNLSGTIPEPGTASLLGVALLVLAAGQRRHRRRR